MKFPQRILFVCVPIVTVILATLQISVSALVGSAQADSHEPNLLLLLSGVRSNAGPLTANDHVSPYDGMFQYGLNPGYYGTTWSDEDIYRLCYDAGCRSARNSLPDHFLGSWGTSIRADTFTYITSTLQFKEITTFLGGPRPEWQNGKLWQGIYEPIWDSGEEGTPVNDANRFALYVWQVVSTYGDYIDFYEIINEPDYTYSDNGWRDPGMAGNWWDSAPPPAELHNLQAPVYHYIRLLRIAYQVIKKYDPNSYVTPGGLGYVSFLDALLRYTDNPDGGRKTEAFPLTGGAYFDALSIHHYPHFTTREWDGNQWLAQRHSDKAVETLISSKEAFSKTLSSRGYNGLIFPEKPIIVTELNVARKPIGNTLGGNELQRNFTIKALVKAQQHDIKQIYWYATGESADYGSATNPFSLMGFYEKLSGVLPGNQIMTDQGRANLTTFEQIYSMHFDAEATAALQLPATADGAVFRRNTELCYVLWARTTVDNSEQATSTISMPGMFDRYLWDGSHSVIDGKSINLTGAPIFLRSK